MKSKSLEALSRVANGYTSDLLTNEWYGWLQTIREDLERLEKLENYPPEFDGFLYSFEGPLERNKKLEKENEELKNKLSNFEKPILYMCRARASKDFERMRLITLASMLNVPIILEDTETLKEKNAIKILKDKRVNIDLLLNSSECFVYNFYAKKQDLKDLTQEEYNLLKEVLK